MEQNPGLADLLPSLCARALQEFGDQSELSLEMYHDPEIEDHYLVLYVRQQPYDDKIMERINNIWAPFEAQLSAASGYLLVTTDFRPSRCKHGV